VAEAPSVTVRFFAAAKAASGVDQDQIGIAPQATVADVLAAVVEIHGAKLAEIFRRCSFLLDETALHDHHVSVCGGEVLDVLPPFAGG